MDHAQQLGAEQERHADRAADAVHDDAVAGLEALIHRRVAGEHRVVMLDHLVEDRLGDVHPGHLVDQAALGRAGLGAVVGHQQDDAAIGVGDLEGLVEDAIEQRADVEGVSDGAVELEGDAQLLVVLAQRLLVVNAIFGQELALGLADRRQQRADRRLGHAARVDGHLTEGRR